MRENLTHAAGSGSTAARRTGGGDPDDPPATETKLSDTDRQSMECGQEDVRPDDVPLRQ